MEFTYAKFTEDACLRHKLISSFSLCLFLYFSEFKLLMHLKKHYAQKLVTHRSLQYFKHHSSRHCNSAWISCVRLAVVSSSRQQCVALLLMPRKARIERYKAFPRQCNCRRVQNLVRHAPSARMTVLDHCHPDAGIPSRQEEALQRTRKRRRGRETRKVNHVGIDHCLRAKITQTGIITLISLPSQVIILLLVATNYIHYYINRLN